MKKLFLVVLGLILTVSCSDSNTNVSHDTAQKNVVSNDTAKEKTGPGGKELIKQRCYICHTQNPGEKPEDQMIAPPMVGVKNHYMKAYPDKQTFIQKIKEWVKNPSEEKALMPGAVKRWGVMPPLNYPDEELQKIAEIIYDLPMPRRGRGKGKCGPGKCGQGKCGSGH